MSGALRSLFRSCAGTVDGLQNHAGGTKAEEEVPQPEADSEAEKEERPLTIEEARRLAEKMSGEFVVVPDQ